MGDSMKYLINLIKEVSPPHKHKSYEIIVYTKGKGIFHTNEKDIKTDPGKIIIIPPDTVHSSTNIDKNYERIYINGEFNYIFNLTSPTVIVDNSNSEGLELAKMIYNNRLSNNEYLSTLISAFTHFLLKRIKFENELFLAITNIIEKMTNNFYDNNIDLSSLLKKSGYSEDYIRSQFKKITGKTPTEFLTESRISHACYLIGAYGKSISLMTISEKCGYTDYVYFSRMFKRMVGVSPRKYLMEMGNF